MKKSFTLIELLIVVAIIGVLASMLLPSLRKARIAGYSAVSKSNLRQLYVAFLDYANDNDGRLPRYRISQSNNVCFWTREFQTYFGPSKGVMLMPGLEYQESQWSGYSASDVIRGFNENNQRNKWTGRKLVRIENPTETILLFEGVTLASDFNAEGRVTWAQASNDIGQVSSDLTRRLNFFYNEKMSSVKVDGHVDSTPFKSRATITHSQWTGL